MSTTIDSFLPLVLPSVHSCPQPTAELAILQAALDFCKRTDIAQVILAQTNVVAGTQDYPITSPTDLQFARLLGVSWQGNWLTPVMPDDVQSDVAFTNTTIGTAVPTQASPQYYFQKTTDAAVVSLYPVPDTTLVGGLFIKASYTPTQTATTLPDELYNDWANDIAHGAIAILKSISGQPWTGDPAHNRTMFERGINGAKRQKMFGKLPSGARIQPQSFAGRGGNNSRGSVGTF